MASKKKSAAKKTTTKPAAGNSSGTPVRIRMYRQGLGDCFLITFDPKGAKPVHMLIDCGSLGAKTTGVKLSDVITDICNTTRHLDLLVATHEHKDHVCAFYDVKKQIQQSGLTVGNVWLAWTEDPTDQLAKKIGKPQDLAMALTHAATALKNAGKGNEKSVALGEGVLDVLGFSGDTALGAAKFATTVNEAMDFVRDGFANNGAKTSFHKPGEVPIEPAWLPGFRFYVLGPPYSETKLQDTGEHGSSELYGLAANIKSAAMAAAGVAVADTDKESEMPFDIRFRFQREDSPMKCAMQAYNNPDAQWRRVDHDWLHSAADLALQLDNLTNNTSLALAIERISDGKVFLFPADSQQGNWLSWHDAAMKWTVKDGSSNREVTATDLLNRTVFYKVGHHASHNATAKGKGLELMNNEDELIAFIPVDRAVALGKSPKGSWRMPARPLYFRLLQKCQGRVLRSDIGWAIDYDSVTDADQKKVEEEFKNMGTATEWKAWKASQAKVSLNPNPKLYFEITI
jgi:hypothetical protein